MRFFTLTIAFLFLAVYPAQAKHHHSHHRKIHYDYSDSRVVSHPNGCPRTAFCGCGVSVKVFGHPVRNLFLASNWFKFPRSSPAAGMVAVRNHHVMYILAYDGNGNATVYDPNSGGHQTRIHERSLSGYRIVNPSGGRAYTDLPASRPVPRSGGIGAVS